MSDANNYGVWSWLCFWNSNSINLTTPAVVVSIILLFLLTLCCFTILSIPLSKKKDGDSLQLPPGPRGLPLLGYLPFLGPDLHHDFFKLSETYGPIYKLWLGKKLCIVITSPTIAREVVREQDTVFADRDSTVASLTVTYGGIDVGYSNYGDYWRKMRKVFVRHLMSNTNLGACYGLRRDEVVKCMRSLYSSTQLGKRVDIVQVVSNTMISTTAALLWGNTVEEWQGETFKSQLKEAVDQLSLVLGLPNISDYIPFIASLDIQGVGKLSKKVHQWLDSFFDSVIQYGVAERAADKTSTRASGEKTDILQILLDLQMKNEDPKSSFTNTELKAILTDILTAGIDSTTTTIVWAMARLLHHEDVMEKVTEELTRVVGTDVMVEEFHLPNLKYLDAVLKESLRLHPTLPLLVPKACRENTSLCGYKIPKGAAVYLNVWAIHRDPHVWKKPEEFIPQRFLEDDTNFDLYGNNTQFMPFGSGRRICAGIPLAEKLAKYVLASLVHSFNWKLPQGEQVDFAYRLGLSLKKLNPLVAIPTPKSVLYSSNLPSK